MGLPPVFLAWSKREMYQDRLLLYLWLPKASYSLFLVAPSIAAPTLTQTSPILPPTSHRVTDRLTHRVSSIVLDLVEEGDVVSPPAVVLVVAEVMAKADPGRVGAGQKNPLATVHKVLTRSSQETACPYVQKKSK